MKILYFTKGFTPTAAESKEIEALGKDVHVRNAMYADAYEHCDKVAGHIPDAFKHIEEIEPKKKAKAAEEAEK